MEERKRPCMKDNAEKLRILEVIPFLGFGGVTSTVMDLSKALSKMGNDLKIAVLFRNSNQDIEDYQTKDLLKHKVEVFQFKKMNRNFFGASISLIKLVKQIKPDVIHLHLRYSVLAALFASFFWSEIVVVETYHSNYKGYKAITSLSRLFISHYVAVSNAAAEELTKKFGIPSGQVRVINNGIDTELINQRKLSDRKRERDGRIVILAAGRLSYEKGFLELVQAFTQLPKSIEKSLKLILIGDGPQKKEILELISSSKFNIEFVPNYLPRNELLKSVSNADIVAMPSLFEGMSVFALEVLALGKPVLVSDIPSFREVLSFTGLKTDQYFKRIPMGLVFGNHPNSIAKSLEWFSQHFETLEEFSRKSIQRSESFKIELAANKYQSVFLENCFYETLTQ